MQKLKLCFEHGYIAAIRNCRIEASKERGLVLAVINHNITPKQILEKYIIGRQGPKTILEATIVTTPEAPKRLSEYYHWIDDIGFRCFEDAAKFEAQYYYSLFDNANDTDVRNEIFYGALARQYIGDDDMINMLYMLAPYADDELAQEIMDYGVIPDILEYWADTKNNNISKPMRQRLKGEAAIMMS